MDDERRKIILQNARAAIANELGVEASRPRPEPWLEEQAATFVTLRVDGDLRGCIGTVEPHRTLLDDVRENAVAAAFRDHRFPPLKREELPRARIEISLLSPVEPFDVEDEGDAIRKLRPGIDGVVLEYRGRKATFLPQVWETLPDPREFLAHLKMKMGESATFWSPAIHLFRYTCEKWKEP